MMDHCDNSGIEKANDGHCGANDFPRSKYCQPCGHPKTEIVTCRDGTEFCGKCGNGGPGIHKNRDTDTVVYKKNERGAVVCLKYRSNGDKQLVAFDGKKHVLISTTKNEKQAIERLRVAKDAWLCGFDTAQPITKEQAQEMYHNAEAVQMSEKEIQKCIKFVGEHAAKKIRQNAREKAYDEVLAAWDTRFKVCSKGSFRQELEQMKNNI